MNKNLIFIGLVGMAFMAFSKSRESGGSNYAYFFDPLDWAGLVKSSETKVQNLERITTELWVWLNEDQVKLDSFAMQSVRFGMTVDYAMEKEVKNIYNYWINRV